MCLGRLLQISLRSWPVYVSFLKYRCFISYLSFSAICFRNDENYFLSSKMNYVLLIIRFQLNIYDRFYILPLLGCVIGYI